MDLSVDIANHTSLTACLKEFGKRELLSRDCKFRCSECHALQEAYKVIPKRGPTSSRASLLSLTQRCSGCKSNPSQRY